MFKKLFAVSALLVSTAATAAAPIVIEGAQSFLGKKGEQVFVYQVKEAVTLKEAQDYCQSLKAGNRSDWMLADKNSLLESMIRLKEDFPLQKEMLWTPEPYGDKENTFVMLQYAIDEGVTFFFGEPEMKRPFVCISSKINND